MKESISNQKVLITGLSGFVGSNLKRYLEDDYQIEPLSIRFIPNQNLFLLVMPLFI